ncbi:MAG TPA: proline dehydrogenase family protein [Clostridia bacterium]|nr:proline dehydrogenase family protein [Clostridia bacterium]
MSRRAALRDIPERALRSGLLTLSRRRVLGRVATRLPLARDMVGRFVAGETLDEALDAIERLRDRGFATTVDILGEAVDSIDAARAAADGYVEALDALAARGLDRNVSLKLTQMGLAVDETACRENVARIVARAVELGGFVRIDMEDHTTVDRTLAVWRAVRPAHGVRGADGGPPDVGVVIQSALRRSPADVELLIAEGARVRLCKGAYQEPSSVAHQDRAEVDGAYAALLGQLLRRGVFPAFATHDPALIREALEVARENGIGPDGFEFQMLYGIRRDLQDRLRDAGYGVRVYVPFGRQWYPYFMRRLAERPQNVAFLLRTVFREGRGEG